MKEIPTNPGCYMFKDGKGIIIYVGKAKNLKKRVSSYFSKNHEDTKTQLLVANIQDVDFIVTNNEIEALILENNLIKKHQPRYNILLKDSKRYAYIQLKDEKFPRLVLARKKSNSGTFYGPFTSAEIRNYVLDTVIRTFKIRTCRKLPKKECLRYHIDLCSGPCIGKVTEFDYQEQITNAEFVLKGKTSELINQLKSGMQSASSNQQFELALNFRKQIESIEWLENKQTMERNKLYNEDIISYLRKGDKIYLLLFHIYKGTLENKQTFEFDFDENFLDQFLVQYYEENPIPKEIVIKRVPSPEVANFLSELKGSKVRFVQPKIGEKQNLLRLVDKNIELTFFAEEDKLIELQEKLKLNDYPRVIECFDISHLSGTNTVASMVQFRNGLPDKSNYRRFKIKTVSGIDDFESMREVVYRRYSRLLKENQPMPNLVVIDGGKGQLSSAMESLKQLGVKIPVISLAKKLEEIYFPGSKFPLRLSHRTKALKLLQNIRDEAHRFAISYNRLLRKKEIK